MLYPHHGESVIVFFIISHIFSIIVISVHLPNAIKTTTDITQIMIPSVDNPDLILFAIIVLKASAI
jgi:hypothetical protein